MEFGYRLSRARKLVKENDGAHSAIEGSVLALLGLILAFAFSGVSERLEHRRDLLVDEANAIGTAYLRTDLFPAGDGGVIKSLIHEFVLARLSYNDAITSNADLSPPLLRANQIQGDIWTRAVQAHMTDETRLLVLPSLNEMFDSATRRTVVSQTHLPLPIFCLLLGLAAVSALLMGRSMAVHSRRGIVHRLLFTGTIALTIYVICDLDHPRLGLIRIGAADDPLMQLEAQTNPSKAH